MKQNESLDAMTQEELDLWLVEQAEREANAQLVIIRALKPLARGDRERVIGAVQHILAADGMVPGVFRMIAKRAPPEGKSVVRTDEGGTHRKAPRKAPTHKEKRK